MSLESSVEYRRIEKAIRYLIDHADRQPGLREVADALGISEYQLQRVFTRWAGVSPKRFLQYLTATAARERLIDEAPTLRAAFDVGLSGPGRLHDLMVAVDAMTPAEVRARGRGLRIRLGTHHSPFGPFTVAVTDRGICSLAFHHPADFQPEKEIRARWPLADFVHSSDETRWIARRIAGEEQNDEPLPLLLRGTNFQIRVWDALLRIPPGRLASYETIGRWIGAPGSARAVGSAVARNDIAFLIPCHRVIRSTGVLGEYRWGAGRKRAMAGWEAARTSPGKPTQDTSTWDATG